MNLGYNGIQQINIGHITGSYYCCNTDFCNSETPAIENAIPENSYNSASNMDIFNIISFFFAYQFYQFACLNL
uniref:Uncharacterized protein n=1 Tax=Panagrolaimus superbus TaxID=310955 RepID=A0A914YIA0_9BILA